MCVGRLAEGKGPSRSRAKVRASQVQVLRLDGAEVLAGGEPGLFRIYRAGVAHRKQALGPTRKNIRAHGRARSRIGVTQVRRQSPGILPGLFFLFSINYAEQLSQASPTISTLPRTACSELCRGGTTVRSPKPGIPLDSYAGVAAMVGAFLAIAIKSIWPARTASASTIAATSPWLIGEGIDSMLEATEVLLPSALLVAPNLAMLTVDFSIRLAPMVRR